jgi:hypothetical protein
VGKVRYPFPGKQRSQQSLTDPVKVHLGPRVGFVGLITNN